MTNDCHQLNTIWRIFLNKLISKTNYNHVIIVYLTIVHLSASLYHTYISYDTDSYYDPIISYIISYDPYYIIVHISTLCVCYYSTASMSVYLLHACLSLYIYLVCSSHPLWSLSIILYHHAVYCSYKQYLLHQYIATHIHILHIGPVYKLLNIGSTCWNRLFSRLRISLIFWFIFLRLP